jgi:hypothetical protein
MLLDGLRPGTPAPLPMNALASPALDAVMRRTR